MKKDELKDIMERTLEKSKSLLLRDGYVSPLAFICVGNKIDVIDFSFKNNEDKERKIYAIRKMARMRRAGAVFVVTESWYITSDKKDLSITPSKHPMRKECIFVVGECEEGDVAIIQKFERKEIKNGKREEKKDEIIFGEKDDMDTMSFSKFNFGIKKLKDEKR